MSDSGGTGGLAGGFSRNRAVTGRGASTQAMLTRAWEAEHAWVQDQIRLAIVPAIANARPGGYAPLAMGFGYPGIPLEAQVNPIAHLTIPFPHQLAAVLLLGQPSAAAATWNCTVDLKVAVPSAGLAEDATDIERAENALQAFNDGQYPSICGSAKPSLHDEYGKLQSDLTPYTQTTFPAWSFWVVYLNFVRDMDVLTIEPIFRRT